MKRSNEYLKEIYVLNKKNNEVRVTDIASIMNCSKPSVTKQLNILSNDGFIKYESYGKIELTEKGIVQAQKLLEEENIIFLFFSEVIGISNDNIEKDSSMIKSVISDETLESIKNYVYVKLGLDKLNCNFDIKSEKCRECIIRKKE